MININELWVGDDLRQISTGRIGKYQGAIGQKVRMKIGELSILISARDVELYTPPPVEENIEFISVPIENIPEKVDDSIDLHIEKLAPHMLNQSQARILDFQLLKTKEYLEAAMAAKKFQILIIHGKGTGTLKAAVLSLLKDYKKVRYTFDKNQGGATEVWLDI